MAGECQSGRHQHVWPADLRQPNEFLNLRRPGWLDESGISLAIRREHECLQRNWIPRPDQLGIAAIEPKLPNV